MKQLRLVYSIVLLLLSVACLILGTEPKSMGKSEVSAFRSIVWHVPNPQNFCTDTWEVKVNKVLNSSCNFLRILCPRQSFVEGWTTCDFLINKKSTSMSWYCNWNISFLLEMTLCGSDYSFVSLAVCKWDSNGNVEKQR